VNETPQTAAEGTVSAGNRITYTPGPWTFKAARNAPQDLGGYLTGPKGEYLGDVQWRGNGPLLAAAPDLLAALQAVLKVFDPWSVPGREPLDAHSLAVLAIAKATGETVSA
jgi:hypothetical protein